jgi:hypothetical protein
MARVKPEAYNPTLMFRFAVEFPNELKHIHYYGKASDLPKWTNVNGWENEIKILCYHFEGITVNELSEMNTEDVTAIIKILNPDESTLYEWRLKGDVIKIDYGYLDRAIENVTLAEITFLPKECIIVFEP